MTTNILQLLHTTAAYQSAVMQLLVNEANFTAKQLDLKETVPAVVAADTNRWEVDRPPEGIGGSISSSNYSFWFHEGRLRSVDKLSWLSKISPPAAGVLELANRPSLLDTNTAYALAKESLASLSIDVAALEKKYPPRIFQPRGKKRGPDAQILPGSENILAVPLFMIGWGEEPEIPNLPEQLRQLNRPRPNRPPSDRSPVYVELLGTTRELLELKINDASLFTRPALQLADADKLLGPTPPPKHFVEELVGGPEAFQTIASPDKVEAWLLASDSGHGGFKKKDRTGPLQLKPENAKAFSDALIDFNSYLWNVSKDCIMDPGARLRFTRGKDVVDIWLCYECDMLAIIYGGKTKFTDFDPAHKTLVRALQTAFPKDQVVQSLRLER
jgi:hypothetical protein